MLHRMMMRAHHKWSDRKMTKAYQQNGRSTAHNGDSNALNGRSTSHRYDINAQRHQWLTSPVMIFHHLRRKKCYSYDWIHTRNQIIRPDRHADTEMKTSIGQELRTVFNSTWVLVFLFSKRDSGTNNTMRGASTNGIKGLSLYVVVAYPWRP